MKIEKFVGKDDVKSSTGKDGSNPIKSETSPNAGASTSCPIVKVDDSTISESAVVKESIVTESKSTVTLEKPPKGKTAIVANWDPNDFLTDTEYFAVTFGLPNEGKKPHSINDIPDEKLLEYFGPKGRSGYKLSSVSGISIDDILHLSQIVDGYERPVNGVLAHTFVKGVYAERIDKRKVNWASYAATKLKGQILQWERERKGKPVGPPCVRKLQVYKPSGGIPEGQNQEMNDQVNDVVESGPLNAVEATLSSKVMEESDPSMAMVPAVNADDKEDQDCGALRSTPTSKPIAHVLRPPSPSLVLAILRSGIVSSKNELSKAVSQLNTIREQKVALHKSELQIPFVVEKISAEILELEVEASRLVLDIEFVEVTVEDLTTQVELEDNKDLEEVEGSPTDVTTIFHVRLHEEKSRLVTLKEHLANIPLEIQKLKELRVTKESRVEQIAKLRIRLGDVTRAVESKMASIKATIECQEEELCHLESILSAPCPSLSPRFIPTSTLSASFEFFVSNCPICCNGYHYNNWIPTSCEHTYHPACLFQSIGGPSIEKKCFACGEPFSNDWLLCWGLPTFGEKSEESVRKYTYINELQGVYGKHSQSLRKRRKRQHLFESTQGRDSYNLTDEHLSTIETSNIVLEEGDNDVQEIGSSKPTLAKVKVEAGCGTRRKRRSVELDSSTKVIVDLLTTPELGTIPFTPDPESKLFVKNTLQLVNPAVGQSDPKAGTGNSSKRSKRNLSLGVS